jgi:F-box domain
MEEIDDIVRNLEQDEVYDAWIEWQQMKGSILTKIELSGLLRSRRMLQARLIFVKLMHPDPVMNDLACKHALMRLDASIDAKRGLSLALAPGPASASRFRRVPEVVLEDIAQYLDGPSVVRLGATCKHLHPCSVSEGVWRWRMLDLSHLGTYRKWTRALQIGHGSAHWKCATWVKAPKANGTRVACELLSFFRNTLTRLDVRAVHHVAITDYVFWISRRHYYHPGNAMEQLVLPAAALSDVQVERFTQRTLARVLWKHCMRTVPGVDTVVAE